MIGEKVVATTAKLQPKRPGQQRAGRLDLVWSDIEAGDAIDAMGADESDAGGTSPSASSDDQIESSCNNCQTAAKAIGATNGRDLSLVRLDAEVCNAINAAGADELDVGAGSPAAFTLDDGEGQKVMT